MTARTNTRRMHQLRADFFDHGKHLDANPDTRDQANCWICKRRIDYDAPPGTTPDSHELDHAVPVSINPALQEDPTNFRHAHKRCNSERGNDTPTAGLGAQVPDWW